MGLTTTYPREVNLPSGRLNLSIGEEGRGERKREREREREGERERGRERESEREGERERGRERGKFEVVMYRGLWRQTMQKLEQKLN